MLRKGSARGKAPAPRSRSYLIDEKGDASRTIQPYPTEYGVQFFENAAPSGSTLATPTTAYVSTEHCSFNTTLDSRDATCLRGPLATLYT